jgi:hypothetical protein
VYVITPIAECIDLLQDGTVVAKFGYQNNGQGETSIEIGEFNRFSPGLEDRGQPVTFLTGRISNSFTVSFPSTDVLEWFLGNASVSVDLATARCGGSVIECVETDNTDTLRGLDNNAIRQDANVRALVRAALSERVTSKVARQLEAIKRQAHDLYLIQWSGIWGSFSKISNSCTGCLSIEKAPNIAAINSRSRQFRRLSRKAYDILARARSGRMSSAGKELLRRSQDLHLKTEALSAKLPRFESQCQ